MRVLVTKIVLIHDLTVLIRNDKILVNRSLVLGSVSLCCVWQLCARPSGSPGSSGRTGAKRRDVGLVKDRQGRATETVLDAC